MIHPGPWRRWMYTRLGWKTLAVLGFALLLGLSCLTCLMTRMPGQSFRGAPPPPHETLLAAETSLRSHVQMLAGQIGERNTSTRRAYAAAADYIAGRMQSAHLAVRRQDFLIDKVQCTNVIGQKAGASRPEEIVVIGAHYDSVFGCPGANDNATGVAAMLVLADRLADSNFKRTLRFAAFANEEPPYFQSPDMGSWVYAKECRQQNENIVAMLSLETMGCFDNRPGSQSYPFPMSLFYPSEGNFIAFVSDLGSRSLLHNVLDEFRLHAQIPSEGAALPKLIQPVGWSDHWSFWQEGYPALMVTDTAPFRYPSYHTSSDTPDKIDYLNLARVTEGLEKVVIKLAELQPG